MKREERKSMFRAIKGRATYLLCEPVAVKCGIKIDKPKQMPHGWQHTFTNMVPISLRAVTFDLEHENPLSSGFRGKGENGSNTWGRQQILGAQYRFLLWPMPQPMNG